MNPLLLAVVVALVVPLITRGSYRSLAATRWELTGILLLGLGLQVGLDLGVVPRSRWHDIGFGVLVGSYVLVLAFSAANLAKAGMGVVLVGVALNMLAISVNQGMPVDVPQRWLDEGRYEQTVKHHLRTDDDTLIALSDIIVLPSPFSTVISFGDLIIVVGLMDGVFHASRRRRDIKRPLVAATATPNGAPPVDEEFETDDIGALLRITDAYLASFDERAGYVAAPPPDPPPPDPSTPAESGSIDSTSTALASAPLDEFVPTR